MKLHVIPVPGPGAEDVVVATDGPDEGAVFTGTEDGSVFRVSHDGSRVDKVGSTGGRPLGIEYADGRLLICDAHRGVLWMDPRTGTTEKVTDTVGGRPMKFCNNAAVAADGTIWFSDSSRRFGIEQWKDDLVQHTHTGRLFRRDPDGTVTTVLDGIAFANGVALSADGSFVAVASTGGRSVHRRWIDGERAGTSDLLCSDLPGYPDNIARGSDGLIWITIASPKDPVLEVLQRSPMPLRKVVTKIPEALQPKPKQTVRVQAYDDSGTLVHDLDVAPQDRVTPYHMATGVREHDGRVWVGSLHEPAIAYIDR